MVRQSRSLFCSVFFFAVTALILSGCGDSNTATAVATATPTDPYASLTDRQVAQMFIDAYRTGNYALCVTLLTPEARANLTSPDSFALGAHQRVDPLGGIKSAVISQSVPWLDSEERFLVTVTWNRSDVRPDDDWVNVQRINMTWKVAEYEI